MSCVVPTREFLASAALDILSSEELALRDKGEQPNRGGAADELPSRHQNTYRPRCFNRATASSSSSPPPSPLPWAGQNPQEALG